MFEHGDDCITRYGWATLRAASLQGLSSQPSDKEVAETGKCSLFRPNHIGTRVNVL